MNNPFEEAYKKQDEICSNLIKTNPIGYYDKEFEELLILKSKMEGYDAGTKNAQKEFLDIFKQHCNDIILSYHKEGIDIQNSINSLYLGVKQSLEVKK